MKSISTFLLFTFFFFNSIFSQNTSLIEGVSGFVDHYLYIPDPSDIDGSYSDFQPAFSEKITENIETFNAQGQIYLGGLQSIPGLMLEVTSKAYYFSSQTINSQQFEMERILMSNNIDESYEFSLNEYRTIFAYVYLNKLLEHFDEITGLEIPSIRFAVNTMDDEPTANFDGSKITLTHYNDQGSQPFDPLGSDLFWVYTGAVSYTHLTLPTILLV